jgi:diaminopimelate decarboxylase
MLCQVPHLTCFAMKANSNLAVLRIFIKEGGGVDIVSGGELYRSLQAGVDPAKVVYSGVGKRMDEIEYALTAGILLFNVESLQELEVSTIVPEAEGQGGDLSARQPRCGPGDTPHISTGMKENKFGIDVEEALAAYGQARSMKNLDVKGVSCHIGSQLTKITPFIDALERLKYLIGRLEASGTRIRYLDLGEGAWASATTKRSRLTPNPMRGPSWRRRGICPVRSSLSPAG